MKNPPFMMTDEQRNQPSTNKSLSSRRPNVSLLSVLLTFLFLGINAAYLTSPGRTYDLRHLSTTKLRSNLYPIQSLSIIQREQNLQSRLNDGLPVHWPELFIFRRTKKTGSSSMMNALMDTLKPFGYYALPHMPNELEDVIRNEYLKPKPRRLMVLHHNEVTKNMHPNINKAIIADTLRDGFKHVTGYCRYMKGVRTCNGADMIKCLESNRTQTQIRYRWAGEEKEDKRTYIDLPLSSEFPALSTTVFRSVFNHPNITLKLDRYNMRKMSCNENSDTKAKRVYDQLYGELDDQVNRLRKRMLVIAGYPYKVDQSIRNNVTLIDMMKVADDMENQKYSIGKIKKVPPGKSTQVNDLLRLLKIWKRDENGKLFIAQRRDL